MWAAIQADLKALEESVDELGELGRKYADADAGYRMEKAKAILRERSKGTPATIARDVIYAEQKVFDALIARDCAEAEYDAGKEAINSLKLRIRVTEAQMQREWTQSGNRSYV